MVQYYKKQGAEGYFKPFAGFFHDRMNEARQQGDFFTYFKRLINRHPNTSAVISNIGSKTMLCLLDADMIKEFVNQPQLYKKTEFTSGIEGLFEGQGILFSEGEQWKKQRKLLTASFQNELLKDQVPVISRIAERVYGEIGKTSQTKDLSHVDIMKVNQRISGDIMGEFFFGKNYNEYTFEGLPMTVGLRKLLNEGFKEMYTIWNAIFGAWLIRAGILPKHKQLMSRIKNLRETLKSIVETSKRKNVINDEDTLLKTLITHQKQSEYAMTDEEIVDNFISLFLAATDPTGNLVSIILYYLSKNPEIYQKTMNEIEKIAKEDKELNFEQVHRMEYTMAVIKEALRKANPQGLLVFREAVEDHRLKNMHIKKGTLVTFSPILNGFNRKYFLDFETFDPERWLTRKDKNSELKEHPFAFIPFSAGPRACPGQYLAFIETKIMLSSFLRKFNMSLSNDYNLKMTNRGTYEPLENIKMSLSVK